MSRLRDNGFQLIFRGSYKRINHRKKLSVGRWKAKLLDNKNDRIIGFTKFSKPESSKTYHNGAVYIDSNRNKIYDDTSSDHAVYDKRIPTSYRSLDYTKKMIKMQKGKVKVWFSKQAKIPNLMSTQMAIIKFESPIKSQENIMTMIHINQVSKN